ncbi:MAG: hypothetical protein N4A31_06890 [Rickettsiales bacterium]|jgi:5-carboxymethyl-2-hydroxymuconate isomerase|nr:hypothetical protein [Rickettsiales bacterium]
MVLKKMPQIILEASDNIIERDFKQTLSKIHHILVDTLPTKLESCKSRVILHKDFLIGNGYMNNAFIHLSIKIIEGRTRETCKLAANKILEELKDSFQESMNRLNLKFSIAIDNLPKVYIKT